MVRYCKKCDSDYDFAIKSMNDLDSLVCPVCGERIDKNSRRESGRAQIAENEIKIGRFFQRLYEFAYVFYLILAIIGILAFVFHADILLYVVTGISLCAFVIQFFTGTLIFKSGLFFLPAGAITGFLLFNRSIEGACLGVHVVFAVRHFLRDVFFRFIGWLIRMSST